MRISRWSIFLCLFAIVPARAADEPATKPIEEVFEAALVDGFRVGHVATTVHRHDKDGNQLRTTSTLELTLRRYGAIVRLRKEEGSVETPEGKLLAVFMRQGQAGGRQLGLTGIVGGHKLHV